MPNSIEYTGSDKWKQKATELLNQSGTTDVEDVKVIDADHPQGQSVVTNKVAEIDLTGYAKTSDIVQSDWNEADTTAPDYIKNKPTIPAAQVQSDWLEVDTTKKSYILNKPTIPSTAADVGAIPTTEKGANSGVAELDSNGKVPSSQLPSYVDDVVEVADYASLPSTGETGKIYITLDDNKTYRWSGSAYVEISPSLALGETSSTAYRGDRGKTAYDHATESGRASTTASGLYKIGVTAEGHVASATAVQKSDITALGIPSSDTNTTYTLGASGNNLTLTPSSGSAQSVTAPYATNAGKVNNHTVGMDIPTPQSGDETKYLGGDGTFQEVSPKREASGSVVSFSDGSTYPLSKCVVSIEPVQAGSGEPSPTNIRPISGWTEANVVRCGVNVWDEETQLGYYDAGNGSYTAYNQEICSKNFIAIKPNTKYRGVGGFTGRSSLVYYDKNKSYIGWGRPAGTFTTPSNAYYIQLNFGSDYGTTYNNDTSINYPSTDTAYHAYQGNTYTISFSSAGTVYGGTLDVLTGDLVVDRAMVDLGSPTWGYTNGRFYYNPTNAKVYTQGEVANLLCSQYPTSRYSSQADNTISSYARYIYVRADSYGRDITAFKQAMSGVQLVYELDTPQTYTLTATQISTLLGNNTIYADTGDISVEYVKEPFEGIYDNDKVQQTNTTANIDYRVLLSGSANNNVGGVAKQGNFTYNPSKKAVTIGARDGGSGSYGKYSLAVGEYVRAEGEDSLAVGFEAQAKGLDSVAFGQGTKATHKAQVVFGTYNTPDTSSATSGKGDFVELIGNGTGENARSNARTLDWSGNETLAGKLTVGANPTNAMDVATKDYVDGLIAALRQQLGL